MNEARSLSYKRDIVDIYSNSWGPHDSGSSVDGPSHLTSLALERGVKEVCLLGKHYTESRLVCSCFFRDEMERDPYFYK